MVFRLVAGFNVVKLQSKAGGFQALKYVISLRNFTCQFFSLLLSSKTSRYEHYSNWRI